MILAGTPPTITLDGISLVTTAPAPIMELSPIFTSFKIVTLAPIQTFFPIITFPPFKG